jgi:hypothetical protein
MFLNIIKSVYTPTGKIIISIILGFGFASLFRKNCKNNDDCIDFKGPPIDEISKNTYKHDNKCYQFKHKAITCNANKNNKLVSFA